MKIGGTALKLKNRPTMGDVARLAGVSQPTVSNVINGMPNVSEAMRTKVWQAVEELGYIPNAAAQMLKTSSSKTIGLVVPDIESNFYTEMIKFIEEILRRHGYLLYLCNTSYTRDLEEQYFHQLLQYHVDGMIICYGLLNSALYGLLEQSRVPFIVLDGQVAGQYPELFTVDNDNFVGSDLVVEHLCALGCRNICYASEPLYNQVLQSRYDGFLHAMARRDLPVDKGQALLAHKQYNKVDMGFDIGTQILLNPSAEAIYASSDYMAIGVVKRLAKAGMRIPDDMLLVGYDDIVISDLITPALTTVYQPKREMADTAVQMLLTVIGGGVPEERHVYLTPHLVVRESSIRL